VAIEHSIGLGAPSEGKSGSSRHLIFGIVAVGLFMSSIDTTIVATPIAGKISDELGRRRIFFCAVALFTVASLLCGLATNIYLLVAFRAIQAIGGG
jgi:MFS family permease